MPPAPPHSPTDSEPVWRALASPIRREMLDRLRGGPLSTSDLVLFFPEISRFAVMQHLDVLEEAGLVIPHKFGRVRMNCLNVVPLRAVLERWISRYEALWADELIELKARIEGTGGGRSGGDEMGGQRGLAGGGRERLALRAAGNRLEMGEEMKKPLPDGRGSVGERRSGRLREVSAASELGAPVKKRSTRSSRHA
ncbi:MAG: ArsR/SmtB family transcription factor [Phycisphaerales bacterium]